MFKPARDETPEIVNFGEIAKKPKLGSDEAIENDKKEKRMLEELCFLSPGRLNDFPLTNTNLLTSVEPFTWTWVLASLAAGVLSWVGSKFMEQVFGSSTTAVFNEMVRAVEQIVDLRFTQFELAELESQTTSIVENLRVFNNTPSLNRIDIVITKIIDAENYCLAHFKEARGILSFRYHLMLISLRLQAHQDRMKFLYDQGKRENREDLINESYGEIRNIQQVLGAYTSGSDARANISNSWSIWNESRFGQLFQTGGFPHYLYFFERNPINTGVATYEEAYSILDAHKKREFDKIFESVLLPWIRTLKSPLMTQIVYLTVLTTLFNEYRQRKPNYYEIESFAKLIHVNTLPPDPNSRPWMNAIFVMRNELSRGLNANISDNLSAPEPPAL